jgi:ribosomal protein L29
MINSREQTIEQLMKENDQMHEELAELKWSADLQQTKVQTNRT